ncbi:response regulator transcription factor [Candidatus Gracilibacteria bacterium]|nr:response regulator transcription factor [Candidatus Gracilibacteria bacterium]
MNILIIEDDETLAYQIANVFDAKIISNRIKILHSPLEFITELPFISTYDIIITDLQLGENSIDLWGYKIIQLIRERNIKIPIIVLSGRSEIDVLRTAFDLGASDYLIKPIRLKELELRVLNWFRQYQFFGIELIGKIYTINGLEYNLDKNQFYKDGAGIMLTRMNKYLLSLFFSHSEKILKEEYLKEKIWGDHTLEVKRNLRIAILRLKKALEPYEISDWISNVRGEGYIFQPKN